METGRAANKNGTPETRNPRRECIGSLSSLRVMWVSCGPPFIEVAAMPVDPQTTHSVPVRNEVVALSDRSCDQPECESPRASCR